MVTFEVFPDEGDGRGASFSFDAYIAAHLGEARSLHVATIVPGSVRGNHYHREKRELILVMPGCPWLLSWDEGTGSVPQAQCFDGASAILVKTAPGASHAVTNTGSAELTLISATNRAYAADDTDCYARRVTRE